MESPYRGSLKGSLKVTRPSRRAAILDFCGLSLDVGYTFYPFHRGYHEKGGGQIDPDEPAHNEIESVTIEGTSISLYELLDHLDALNSIDELLPNEED